LPTCIGLWPLWVSWPLLPLLYPFSYCTQDSIIKVQQRVRDPCLCQTSSPRAQTTNECGLSHGRALGVHNTVLSDIPMVWSRACMALCNLMEHRTALDIWGPKVSYTSHLYSAFFPRSWAPLSSHKTVCQL
jgi:hypothetical protein